MFIHAPADDYILLHIQVVPSGLSGEGGIQMKFKGPGVWGNRGGMREEGIEDGFDQNTSYNQVKCPI